MLPSVKTTKFIIKKLEELLEEIDTLKTKSDFVQLRYKMSDVFEGINEGVLLDLPTKTSLHADVVNKIFQNKIFKNSLLTIFNSDNIKDENIEEKQLVYTGLVMSAFILSNIINYSNENTIMVMQRCFHNNLENICLSLERKKHTVNSMCYGLLGIIFHRKSHYNEKTKKYSNLKLFFNNSKMSIALLGILFVNYQRGEGLSKIFKKVIQNKKKLKEKFSITFALNDINQITSQFDFFHRMVPDENREAFIKFNNLLNQKNNEKHSLYFIKKMTEGFVYIKGISMYDLAQKKINESTLIKKDLYNYVNENLAAYTGSVGEGDIEWSNKIYLISIKTLSIFEALKGATDSKWVINVFIRELYHWIGDVHQVLNKYDIEDDWDKISDLVLQENNKIEWKSTFLMPTEQKYTNDVSEKELNKIILSLTIKAMLGMMNTEGGIILVGVVENPHSIVREDVKRNLIVKNRITFFDIHYEFEKKVKTFDSMKRMIQDYLFKETFATAEKFNELWSIEPIEIKSDFKIITIYKITVYPSDKNIYNVKKEKDTPWITLTKRADGRTIMVDPRDYIN